MPSPSAADQKMWVEQEFQTLDLPDQRLKKRALKIAADFAAAPQANIPQASGGKWARSKAAYRFFDNDAVDAQELVGAHRDATLERMGQESLVFAIQDTSFLNFTTHPCTEGLGPIGNNRERTIGLIAHSALAVSQSGLALGLLDGAVSARDPQDFQSKVKRRNRVSIQEKESYKWLRGFEAVSNAVRALPGQTRVVSISDRESDIYELFLCAQQHREQGGRVELLVRAKHQRQIEQSEAFLWDHVCEQARAAKLVVAVPRQPGQRARKATLSIRFCAVRLCAPMDRQKYQKLCTPLSLWAVEAREENPPRGVPALCWRLLTTMEVSTPKEAIDKVLWYTLRWQIEVFHKILKSGCKAEERQLENDQRLTRALMIDMIVAWRILALSKMGRETPGCPASALLAQAEWKALYCYMEKTNKAPVEPPNLGQALRWVAQLGGFLGRRRDRDPGPVVLWRGLQRLTDITETWLLFQGN